jgi:aspartate aminotransferase-like enzyme
MPWSPSPCRREVGASLHNVHSSLMNTEPKAPDSTAAPWPVSEGDQSPLLFTQGPVALDAETREWACEPMAWTRTRDFVATMLRCEGGLKAACRATQESRAVLLAGSGTSAVEAAIANLFDSRDRLVVVKNGDFGRRLVDICAIHEIHVREISLPPGRSLGATDLDEADASGCTALVMVHHETSTGALNDISAAGRFCRSKGLMLVVDAIGSFLADPIEMAVTGVDALVGSSHTALALPPGLGFIVLSARGAARVAGTRCRSYSLDLKRYLADGERGQTPFTPPVGIIRQLERRLESVLARGVAHEISAVASRAFDFRAQALGQDYRLFAQAPSNAASVLEPTWGVSAVDVVRRLAVDHGVHVCPGTGSLRSRILRVGHLGSHGPGDHSRLADALQQIAAAVRPPLLARAV